VGANRTLLPITPLEKLEMLYLEGLLIEACYNANVGLNVEIPAVVQADVIPPSSSSSSRPSEAGIARTRQLNLGRLSEAQVEALKPIETLEGCFKSISEYVKSNFMESGKKGNLKNLRSKVAGNEMKVLQTCFKRASPLFNTRSS
jgi:hypothetical protein